MCLLRMFIKKKIGLFKKSLHPAGGSKQTQIHIWCDDSFKIYILPPTEWARKNVSFV